MEDDRVVVVDASGQVMGRLASKVAKMLLEGNRVYVVNAAGALISGNRRSVIEEWKGFLEVSSAVNPEHGPVHPRRPDRLLKKVIRGMLPRDKPKGREALRRLKVYNGAPPGLPGVKPVRFEEAEPRRPRLFYITLGELAQELGWRP